MTGTFSGDPTSGIIINGVLANIEGSAFVANQVELAPGENSLIARVTTPSGDAATHEIKVTRAGDAPFHVSTHADSGVAPLTTEFQFNTSRNDTLRRIRVDYDGDGIDDVDSADTSAAFAHTYAKPGVYRATFTATDTTGTDTKQALAITVYDAAKMDQLFAGIWTNVSHALAEKNPSRALRAFTSEAQLKYQPVFDTLRDDLPAIANSFSPLARVSISSNHSEYAVVRDDDGQHRVYFVHFVRDQNGIWRLQDM